MGKAPTLPPPGALYLPSPGKISGGGRQGTEPHIQREMYATTNIKQSRNKFSAVIKGHQILKNYTEERNRGPNETDLKDKGII